MRRALVLLVLMTIGGLSMAAFQGAPAKRVRDIQNVRENLYFITGGDTYEVGRGRPTWTRLEEIDGTIFPNGSRRRTPVQEVADDRLMKSLC